MNDVRIEGTQSTPAIWSCQEAGTLEMRGDSCPENAFELFTPVLGWIDSFLRDTERPLTLNLQLVYLNTSSVKVMMDIFDMLEEAHRDGRQVAVNWYYDEQNERVAEVFGEFKEYCSFPFVISGRVE